MPDKNLHRVFLRAPNKTSEGKMGQAEEEEGFPVEPRQVLKFFRNTSDEEEKH